MLLQLTLWVGFYLVTAGVLLWAMVVHGEGVNAFKEPDARYFLIIIYAIGIIFLIATIDTIRDWVARSSLAKRKDN